MPTTTTPTDADMVQIVDLANSALARAGVPANLTQSGTNIYFPVDDDHRDTYIAAARLAVISVFGPEHPVVCDAHHFGVAAYHTGSAGCAKVPVTEAMLGVDCSTALDHLR